MLLFNTIINLIGVSTVMGITNNKINTLQQILKSETDTEILHRLLHSPRKVETSGEGVETLQMMMKTLPLSSREMQMIIGESKESVTTTNQDILERIDAPEIVIPVNAPTNLDVSQLLIEDDKGRDYINVNQEYFYEDIDIPSNEKLPLSSAYISNKDPISLSLTPSSSLLASPGDLHFIRFKLQNNAEVTKFILTAGVGGVVDSDEDASILRQRMVFPGQKSFIQTLTPESVLLNTNQTAEITIGVKSLLLFNSSNFIMFRSLFQQT